MTISTNSSSSSSSSSYPHYTNDLLVLPQSDLRRSKPDLVLCSLPLEVLRNASILANAHGASLVTNFNGNGNGNGNASNSASASADASSYHLTTLGTSNTLVVWKNKNHTSTTTTTSSSATNKRQKMTPMMTSSGLQDDEDTTAAAATTATTAIQPTRLVHPGGSGAGFLTGVKQRLTAPQVLVYLKNSYTHYTTHDLALRLQCSHAQVERTMATLPCIHRMRRKRTTTTSTTTSTNQNSGGGGGTWQLLQEEDIWQAQAAVVQTLCEEEDLFLNLTIDSGNGNSGNGNSGNNNDDNDTDGFQEAVMQVAKRLKDTTTTGGGSEEEDGRRPPTPRAQCMARKFLQLASAASPSSSLSSSLLSSCKIDPETVRIVELVGC
jgi:hypothetical protein